MAAPPNQSTHLLADLVGVPASLLNDADLLRGLLIAGASAAALTSSGIPTAPAGSGPERSFVLIVAGGHIAAHTFPERDLLLLDVLCNARHDPRRVLDVVARRLSARDVRSETRSRA
ncbi:MAG TPA: S-adenosylmethionine decarboxylase [Gemmatimonadaceae bacterium]|nr:S-adenosylmethionine decarboxylase [Gemmatimonadaceae bacterium]